MPVAKSIRQVSTRGSGAPNRLADNRKQIVILGAGYAGLCTALRLERLLRKNVNWGIVLVDRNNFHQLKTELHEVAAGRISEETVSIPIARLIDKKNINFFNAEATHIDFVQQFVTTSKGKVKYDKLVIALGSETEFFGIPGMGAQTFTLTSVEDAKRIKNHIREMFVQAKNEKGDAKRQALLTFIIGGGGFTGVELATELVGFISELCRQFEIATEKVQVIVVEAAERILPGFDLELVNQAQKAMKNMGIRLLLKTPCVSAEEDYVRLRGGQKISTRTLIWTGGVRACDLLAKTELKFGPRGRVAVNPYLESVDHPGIYVIGDNALVVDPITKRPLAPSAQLALQQAEIVASNLCAEINGVKRARYTPKVVGEFVSLGGRNAVGWVWKFRVTGFAAWFLKRMSVVRYLYSIGGLKLAVLRLPALFSS